jgi:phenylacetate-CoA ligase
MVAYQEERLRAVVHHAYERVPYYRRLFDAHGLRPGHIRTLADLTNVPITSRADLQLSVVRDVVAAGIEPDRLITNSTSGSSGEPLTIRRTWLEQSVLSLLRRRAMRYLGARPRDLVVTIGRDRRVHPRDTKIVGRVLAAVGLHRQVKLDVSLGAAKLVDQLVELRPDVVIGYSGTLALLAGVLDAEPRADLRPRLVVTGAEVLTTDMRERIARTFHAPVFDTYGSHEFNLLAWECKDTGAMHTCDDGMILEVLQADASAAEGDRGEVVGTSLHSYAMPFIRYRLGDLVTRGASHCRCGAPFATIGEIQGRMIDSFPMPDGRVLHPYDLLRAFKRGNDGWIRQYQILQERIDLVLLRVVPGETAPADARERLHVALAALLGPAVTVQVELVPEIPIEATGKFRVARSQVYSEYDRVASDVG